MSAAAPRLRCYYTDGFPLGLPDGHHFPQDKYARLRRRVEAEPELRELLRLEVAPPAARAELCLAHDEQYVDAVLDRSLDAKAWRKIGFPGTAAVVERSLRSCGATLAAARSATTEGAAVYLGGGTHHASRDTGAGYCVFNDCAVATAMLLGTGRASRVLLLDLDVHQGDGTAAILADEPRAFTFSMHGARNFPRVKVSGDLDVELPDQLDDIGYLKTLDRELDRALALAEPDFVFYLAGADPFVGDKLGRLALSERGLAARDRRVFSLCAEKRLPIVVVMAGGYGRNIEDTVGIHLETVRQAARYPVGSEASDDR